MTLSCQLLNQLSVIDSNIIKLIIWGGIILFFYASILILIDGYHTMWNDLILYPRDCNRSGELGKIFHIE